MVVAEVTPSARMNQGFPDCGIGETTPRRIEPAAIYTTSEAAFLVQMHPKTLQRKLRAGVAVKGRRRAGGHWRILGSELLKFA